MKINKVKLHNFSSYEGNNEFDFEITDAGKNIVLIGGKNGAGKTSLFTAIKVALYGPLAYGYVGVNSHYISKIKDLINSKAFQQEVVESEVQLTLQLKIERDIRNYVITRKWDYTNQKLTEEYTVARDGKLLNDQELSYFENYLRSIIPPDLFEFFLFDGEEVGNIFSTSAYNTYVTLGNGSWNFDNSAMMVYRVQTWVEKWKKTIIQTVNVFDNQPVDYQDCAIATEMIREIMQGVFTGTKVEGIPATNLMTKNLKKAVQNSHCTEWNSLVNMLLNNDEKVKDVITQYYNIIQGNLKSSQVFIRATEFNSDVRKVQKAKLLIPDEQILLTDPISQRREIREIYEKIYTRIPKVAEAEKEKANRLLEQIGMYLDYEDIDDEDIEDLIDKIKLFYETASSSLVNIYGNIQVLDGIKKDAKTISVAFSEVEKGIASTDDLDTLLMFSKDPLSKIERILSILQAVQKDIEYVARDVEKRRGNIFVDNGGDLSTRYVESRNTIEADSKTVMDWKVM